MRFLNQEKKRYIHIMKEDREFIMKSLGVTERTVLNAIRFDEARQFGYCQAYQGSWQCLEEAL